MATSKSLGEIFCEACENGNVEKVSFCIGLEVDVNCCNSPGLT